MSSRIDSIACTVGSSFGTNSMMPAGAIDVIQPTTWSSGTFFSDRQMMFECQCQNGVGPGPVCKPGTFRLRPSLRRAWIRRVQEERHEVQSVRGRAVETLVERVLIEIETNNALRPGLEGDLREKAGIAAEVDDPCRLLILYKLSDEFSFRLGLGTVIGICIRIVAPDRLAASLGAKTGDPVAKLTQHTLVAVARQAFPGPAFIAPLHGGLLGPFLEMRGQEDMGIHTQRQPRPQRQKPRYVVGRYAFEPAPEPGIVGYSEFRAQQEPG